jgi:hypothetical protein
LIGDNAPAQSEAWRRLMLGLSAALALIALLLLVLGVPGIWLPLLIAAAVPAGITLGTQPHKYWV